MQTHNVAPKRIEIYDTTLRDGSQGEGVSFSLGDKLRITEHLDGLGVDFIEGGYPLSNPKDVAYFQQLGELNLTHARICAFGMTRRKGVQAKDDPGMQALVAATKAHGGGASVITIVGKTWDLHVDEVLRISRQENLDMIKESVEFCAASAEVFYDAEHFFDGYRANRDYALQTLAAAVAGGATRLILCDTNGGTLPDFISQAVRELLTWLSSLTPHHSGPKPLLGIHPHNDGGLAVANALAAVQAGCIQVQGTINGIGERCGNVDLTTVIANLRTKMGYDCLRHNHGADGLARLTETSRFVYELANFNLTPGQPFVGPSAFAHKGGMHVHAIQRLASSYEHIDPAIVGNTRRVLVSELSGVSNVSATLGKKFNIADDKELQKKLIARVAELENQGYQFEAAQASFELLLHDLMGSTPAYWNLDHFRCVIFHDEGTETVTEATVKLKVGSHEELHAGEGDGPVNALDTAMRKCLSRHYPQLAQVHLRDYKVRVVNATAESAAKVRVIIEFAVAHATPTGSQPTFTHHFSTIGVSENIVDASWQALIDAFAYHLIEERAPIAG